MTRPHALQVKHSHHFRERSGRRPWRRVSFFCDRVSISRSATTTSNRDSSPPCALGSRMPGGALNGFVHHYVAEQQALQAEPAEAMGERVGCVGGRVGVHLQRVQVPRAHALHEQRRKGTARRGRRALAQVIPARSVVTQGSYSEVSSYRK